MVISRKDDHVIHLMATYMMEHYHSLIDVYSVECPYRFDNEDLDDFVSYMWGTFAAFLPGTKMRLVDDYAKKHVRDPVIASKIWRADNIVVDAFRVLDADRKSGRFLLRSETDGVKYRAVSGVSIADAIAKGNVYTLVIHPWEEDGSYNIAAMFPTKDNMFTTKNTGKYSV